MGREDHGLLLDSKDQWWVECPNHHERIPQRDKPTHCPFCSQFIGTKEEKMELSEAYKDKVGVDFKYSGDLVKTEDGSKVETPWILLLAKDDAVVDTLVFYVGKCLTIGASREHVDGILDLIKRVRKWREENPNLCKVPD